LDFSTICSAVLVQMNDVGLAFTRLLLKGDRKVDAFKETPQAMVSPAVDVGMDLAPVRDAEAWATGTVPGR
jgi:hypothetical protein